MELLDLIFEAKKRGVNVEALLKDALQDNLNEDPQHYSIK
jgi:hypothetical protein